MSELPRPQMGIYRLSSGSIGIESKELMNCHSCRKRKVCAMIYFSINSCVVDQMQQT
jgi:hypothetical protein